MSDYVPKPGSFNLFKNDKKEKESQPDYTGNGAMLDGTPARIAAWLKEGRKGRYFSIKISVDERQQGGGGGDEYTPAQPEGRARAQEDDPFGDSIPFIRW